MKQNKKTIDELLVKRNIQVHYIYELLINDIPDGLDVIIQYLDKIFKSYSKITLNYLLDLIKYEDEKVKEQIETAILKCNFGSIIFEW